MRTCLLLPFLAACAEPEPVPLVTGGGWSAAAAGLDPAPAHDDGAPCGAGGFIEELGGLEVDTELCPYAVLSQPLLADLAASDAVQINWWHSDLVWATEAEGHFLLTLNGATLYEYTAAIPGDAAAFLETLNPEIDAQAGDPLVLHVHNHGFNTWNLFSLERR
jgi:ABC-type glycerol-3-phosphate transport system substrate-binding protein